MDKLPDDFFTTSFQFTEHIYRDAYPGVNPTASQNSQAGKVVIITDASGGSSRSVRTAVAAIRSIVDKLSRVLFQPSPKQVQRPLSLLPGTTTL
jgi:hypothetical protein